MNQKLWCYLSIALLVLPLTWAVGDTFGILQGRMYTNGEVLIQVFDQDRFIYSAQPLQTQDTLFATSITIPATLSQVQLRIQFNGEIIDSITLDAGETKFIELFEDLNEEDKISQPIQESTTQTFEFQPESNQQQIEDITQGNIQGYEDEIRIESLEEIQESLGVSQNLPVQEIPQEQKKPNTLEQVNAFFLMPMVLLGIMVLCCILIIVLISRRRAHL